MAHVPPSAPDDGDPPSAPDDGHHDNLAALDFSGGDVDDADEPDLGAILGEYGSEVDADEPELPDALEWAADDVSDSDPAIPLFTVANPSASVAVTTLMDGRVHRIDLSPNVASLTEEALAEEIVVIAGLATQDARSAQFTFMLEGMREQGHDTVGTRDFLSRDMDLPTPEQAQAARAELFATRYAGEE
ncbi:MAG: hypothetical protein K0U84_12015 [Actinomycetia bacterium]|nr:hypothetical protein [Actinomycetes bacterium]